MISPSTAALAISITKGVIKLGEGGFRGHNTNFRLSSDEDDRLEEGED